MSLTHVLMWKSGAGLAHVTFDEAVHIYPNGASGGSGIFYCGCCFERVTLAYGPCRQYFRHTNREHDAVCPDRFPLRTNDSAADIYTGARILPLYLRLSPPPVSLKFEIGFPPIEEGLLRQTPHMEIRVVSHDGTVLKTTPWNVSNDRFSSDATTRLPVGTEPAGEYRLQFTGPRNACALLSECCGTSVMGISAKGTLFREDTGRILPAGADAEMDCPYLFLWKSAKKLPTAYGVSAERIAGWDTGWTLYRLCAIKLTPEAAQLFLRLGVCLTVHPPHLEPMWPVFLKRNGLLYYEGSEPVFIQYGKGAARAFPTCGVKNWQKHISSEVPYICFQSFKCGELQQLCFGLRNVYHTIYLRQINFTENPPAKTQLPEIVLQDISGVSITGTLLYKLPKELMLHIVPPPFDGHVELWQDERLHERIALKSGRAQDIHDLSFGIEIRIFQGMDLIRSIRFERREEVPDNTRDMRVLRLLRTAGGKNVPFPHAWGNLAARLCEYPQTAQWIASVARKGQASHGSVAVIRKLLNGGNIDG